MTVAPMPYIYEVEPTNACPYRCYMCPRGLGQMKRTVGFMPVKTFEKVLEEVPDGQRMLRLHHFGEPVLHPQIGTFIEITRQRGLIPALSLNPSSLNERVIESLIDSGIGIVCFSFDSLLSERLSRIRGIEKSASSCIEMIDYFVKLSRISKYPVLKVIQMVSLDINRDEQESYISFFKERYPEGDVYVYTSLNYGFGDIELVRKTDSAGAGSLASNRNVCTSPFDDVVILWNGDVVLCCYDYDGFNVIGNINDSPLKKIWSSRRVKSLRETFSTLQTDALKLCGNCYLAPHRAGNIQENLRRGYREEDYILRLSPVFNG